MTVVHIATSLREGGMQMVLYRLATSEKTQKHIVVSLMDENAFGPRLREAGIEVLALNMPSGRITWSGLTTLYRLFRKEKPVAVQTWLYHADLLGAFMARIASNARICWGLHFSFLDYSLLNRGTKLVIKLCTLMSGILPHKVISCSENGRQMHLQLGYNEDRLTVINNGYDFSEFKPDETARQALRQEWGISDDEFLMGTVARWDPQKDHANLVKALHHMQQQGNTNWRCIFIGPEMTEENDALMTLLSQYNLTDNIILVGLRSDIPAVMNALDISVLPSAFGEAFPNVLVESMACGTPCVSTDVGDSAVILDAHGYTVPPSDSQALAHAIGAMQEEYASPDSWAKKQVAGRTYVSENFSLDAMVKAYQAEWQL